MEPLEGHVSVWRSGWVGRVGYGWEVYSIVLGVTVWAIPGRQTDRERGGGLRGRGGGGGLHAPRAACTQHVADPGRQQTIRDLTPTPPPLPPHPPSHPPPPLALTPGDKTNPCARAAWRSSVQWAGHRLGAWAAQSKRSTLQKGQEKQKKMLSYHHPPSNLNEY